MKTLVLSILLIVLWSLRIVEAQSIANIEKVEFIFEGKSAADLSSMDLKTEETDRLLNSLVSLLISQGFEGVILPEDIIIRNYSLRDRFNFVRRIDCPPSHVDFLIITKISKERTGDWKIDLSIIELREGQKTGSWISSQTIEPTTDLPFPSYSDLTRLCRDLGKEAFEGITI